MNITEWLQECLRRIRVFGMPVIARSHLIIGNTFSFGRNNSNIFLFFLFSLDILIIQKTFTPYACHRNSTSE